MELCDFNLETYITNLRKEQMEIDSSSEEENSSPISMKQPLDILKDITSGVVFIHEQGQIHRDLKPHNSEFHSLPD